MSAIETYRMAIEKLADSNEPGVAELQRFQRDHRDAADVLWHHLERKGERPSEGSGAWGAFAKAVEGTAKLLGNKAALKALKEGEEHGLKEYEEALTTTSISRRAPVRHPHLHRPPAVAHPDARSPARDGEVRQRPPASAGARLMSRVRLDGAARRAYLVQQ